VRQVGFAFGLHEAGGGVGEKGGCVIGCELWAGLTLPAEHCEDETKTTTIANEALKSVKIANGAEGERLDHKFL
jgi:hypothetical protein